MGIFDKVKNLFTEEVEEEEIVERKKPVKRDRNPLKTEEIHTEEKKVEIAPARKETALKYEREKEEHKEERKPLYFSDDDFDDLPSIKKEEKKIENKEETVSFGYRTQKPDFSEYKKPVKETKKIETEREVKKFAPSPIISPIYGVLDKNYSKEDIKAADSKMTVDDVRNKAFKKIEEKKIEKELDLFEELETQETINQKIEEEKEEIKNLHEEINETIPVQEQEVTDRKIDNILEELDEIQELIPEVTKSDVDEPVEEGDLFNLIDSMYEKRETNGE